MKWGPLAAIGLVSLAACTPQKPPHYEWGSYEDSLYHYYKDPASSGDYMAVLAKAAATGDKQGRTAPGVHAEYGYMLLSAGRPAEAAAEFETEKRMWPESAVFMDRMIKVTEGQRAPVASTADLSGKTGS